MAFVTACSAGERGRQFFLERASQPTAVVGSVVLQFSPPIEMESATDGSDTNACVCPRSGLLTGAAFNLLPSCAVSSSRVSLLSAWGRERLVFHTAVGCAHG